MKRGVFTWIVVTFIMIGVGAPGVVGADAHDCPPHPYPCGNEWPEALQGPFATLPPENVKIPGDEGVLLDAWIIRPAVPNGVKVPVVLWSAGYFGLNNPAGNDPSGWDNSEPKEAVPVNLLVSSGYAVAIMNLRGSGNSEGCFTSLGLPDRRDNAAAVEWLGTRPWSNGRVGMMGVSDHGTTPWLAAIEDPPHLKTIVTGGMISSSYTLYHTPQGAPGAIYAPFESAYLALVTAPPLLASPDQLLFGFSQVVDDRICPEQVALTTEGWKADHADIRDEAYWRDRTWLPHFPDVTTSVFLTHGLLDYRVGHTYEEDVAWQALSADTPKRMLVGNWGHMFPNFSEAYNADGRSWNAELLAWLDYWLKGLGEEAPREGVVDFQDSSLAWHRSSQWPPAESQSEVAYLANGTLSPGAGNGVSSFRSVHVPTVDRIACAGLLTGSAAPAGVVYVSEPLDEVTTLAGNPFAFLRISSDLPAGQVAVTLFDAAEGACEAPDDTGLRWLAMGAASLRHHAGNVVGTDFPTDTPTDVRVDLNNLAEVIPAGHRIVVVVHQGDEVYGAPMRSTPNITVHEDASHIVLPFLSGSIGGAAPTIDYPSRPFLPAGSEG